MAFGPAARHVGEHRKNRQFIVVIPKNERIVPEKNEAEEDDEHACARRAKNFRARGARSGHPTEENAQRSTPNAQCRTQKKRASFGVFLSGPNAGSEDSDKFIDFAKASGKTREVSKVFQPAGQTQPTSRLA